MGSAMGPTLLSIDRSPQGAERAGSAAARSADRCIWKFDG